MNRTDDGHSFFDRNHQEITLYAHAKINLTLDILLRRPDGYHEVRMIMQELALKDTVTLQRTEKAGILLETEAPDIPKDDRNLCVKAARGLFERFGLPGGLRIGLVKRIPAAAGLAGGSSDAAAVIRGMRTLFDLKLTDQELMAEGKKTGADVPFCVLGGTALSEGIGEILTPVRAVLPFTLLLVKPPAAVSTKEIYEAYDRAEAALRPDTEGMLRALGEGDADGIAKRLLNVLEPVTSEKHPVIRGIREDLMKLGARGAAMSGSGPTVFGLFSSRADAESAEAGIRKLYPEAFTAVTAPVCDPKPGACSGS